MESKNSSIKSGQSQSSPQVKPPVQVPRPTPSHGQTVSKGGNQK